MHSCIVLGGSQLTGSALSQQPSEDEQEANCGSSLFSNLDVCVHHERAGMQPPLSSAARHIMALLQKPLPNTHLHFGMANILT